MNNWPVKKLGELCDFTFGYSFRAENFSDAKPGIPVIRIGDIDKKNTDKFYNKEFDKKYLVYKNDILIGLSGSIKVDKWQGDTALLNQRIVKISNFKTEVIKDFVFYQLPQIIKQLEIQLSQGTVKNILLPHLSNLKISTPSINIQQKIVDRLEVVRKTQELNDLQIKKMEELFNSIWKNEYENLIKDFQNRKLGEICLINPNKKELEHMPDNFEVGFLTMVDVSNEAEIINRQIKKLKEVKKGFTFFKDGDVLFAKITPCMENGKGAFVEKMKNGIGFGSTEFHVLRTNNNYLLNKFLYLFISNKEFRIIASNYMTGSAGQQRVPANYFKRLKISLPSLKEQQKIVEKLEAVQEYKKKLLWQKNLLKELFDSVLDKSMKGGMES